MSDPGQLQAVLSAIAGLGHQLGEMRVDLDQRLDKLDQRIDKLDQRIDKLDQRIDKLDQRIDKFDQRIDQLDQRIDKIEQRGEDTYRELIKTRSDIMARIDRLQDDVTSMRDDLWVTFNRADRIEKKVESNLDGSRDVLRSHSEQLRSLSDELGGVQRQIHHLQNEIRHLKGEP
jgi:chromosome segregation ATPase